MLVREPFHRDGWAYEESYDGYRMMAYWDGGHGARRLALGR
jgi:hypothetical protein